MLGMDGLVFWHWWVLAVILLILEVFSPAAFFIWIGIAAGVVGFIVMTAALSWKAQVLLFAGLSVACVVLGRMWFKRNPIETDRPNLNRRGQGLVGQVFVVEQTISNGTGRIRVGDSTWKVSGADVAAGKKVIVVGVESAVLLVEPVD